ncbi:lipoprotein N-acyltransferase Lnb domain-containing protein [Flavobacterium sp.]
MGKKIFFFFAIFISYVSLSQNQQLSENTQISILTCGRGEELYSTFGHTALRIKDEAHQLDVVYNYGMFDFRTDNFYLKFVKGDLQYFMNATSFEDFILEYQMDKREVVEQTLALSIQKKQALFNSLNDNLFSTEKYYTYKFIDRNCTTKIADKLTETYNGVPFGKVDDKNITYRKLLYPYFDNYFWYKLGINIVFGLKTDSHAEKLFLPIELFNSIDKAKIDGKSIVLSENIIVVGETSTPSFSFFNSIYVIILSLILLLIINSNALFKTYLFLNGMIGLALCLIGFYSQHQEILWNYNALLFNPLFVIIPFIGERFLKKTTLISMFLLLIYCIAILTKPHLVIMLPFIIANFYILIKLNGRNPLHLLTSIKKNRT